MAKASDIVFDFLRNIGKKAFVRRIQMAGKHEILKNKQAKLIADVEEIVIRINGAAPHADAVEIGKYAVLQHPPGALGGSSGENGILDKQGLSIY